MVSICGSRFPLKLNHAIFGRLAVCPVFIAVVVIFFYNAKFAGTKWAYFSFQRMFFSKNPCPASKGKIEILFREVS